MKNIYSKIIVFIAMLTLSNVAFSQNQIAPLEGINYQAVAIDQDGNEIVGVDIKNKPLYEKQIGVRFTIDAGPSGAITYYQDEHTTTTDKYGLFSLVIGKGIQTGVAVYDSLINIPWINGDQWLMVEISIKNDGNFRMVSYEKFRTVPYSFYTDDIADNSITTYKIVDETIQAVDIDTGAVETSEILNETIQAEDIDTSAVTTSEILNETILAEDIATGAVETSEILNGTILNEDIASGTIDLTTKVTNVLPVPNGGTGVSSSTNGGIIVGGGNGPVSDLGVATNGQIPIGDGSGAPTLNTITGGAGITVTNGPGTITITSSVAGIAGQSTGILTIGTVVAQTTFISPPISVPGVIMGTIVVGSYTNDLQGCQLTAYVDAPGTIRVAVYNPYGSNINLGSGDLRVLVVQ